MVNVYSDIIQFRGTHYEFGFYQGEQLKNSPILQHRKTQWGTKSMRERHFIINEAHYRSIIRTFAPKIMEEIEGLADALNMEYEEAIREFGGYYLEYGKSGCSIFTGDFYMVRNYDNSPDSYEGRYVLYEPKDGGYATIGPSMQITGRTDGMNEKGLSMGYNFINRKKSDDGFVCNMIGRMVLESCSDVGEAIQLLKEIPHRHSFTYVLLDPSGQSVVVEATPRAVEVREANYCTNHFEILTEENRYRMDDSERRYNAIEANKESATGPFEAYQMMNDVERGIFSTKYGAWAGTLHTALYLPKDLKVGISMGNNRLPLMMDFQKWLNGDRMHATRIKGELESKEPFINV